MRILIQSFGSYGDIYPFIGLGRELQFRGHEVIFFANGRFESISKEAGLQFVEVGSEGQYETFLENPDMWSPQKGFKFLLGVLIDYLPLAYHETLPYVKPEHTIIIGSSLAFSARLIQETHQIPGVTVHLAPSIFRSVYRPPEIPGLFMPVWIPHFIKNVMYWFGDKYVVDPLVADGLNAFRDTLNLPPVNRVFFEWVHAPDLVIGLFPDWFGDPQPDWPKQVRCTGFPLFDDTADGLDHEMNAFLDSGSRPIVFTAGTAMKHGTDFFDASVKACDKLNRRGILLTRYPEQLPEQLPSEIIHVGYAPFSSLLSRAAALVHHGGIGTTSQALRAGIPQLIRPCAYDQFDNALRLETLGVGKMIDRDAYNPDSVREGLETLLNDPSYSHNCQVIADRFKGINSISESCDHIESIF